MKKAFPLILSGLVLLMVFLVYFPGFMTNDSYLQWQEAQTGNFSNDHPAIMSGLWSILIPFAPPAYPQLPMLCLHLLMLGLGLFLSVNACASKWKWGLPITFLIFFTYPPHLGLMGNIWKDIGMIASWMLAIGLLLQAQYRHKFKCAYWSIPFIFYGMSVRHNAPLAALPFMFWIFAILNKGAGKKFLCKRSFFLFFALSVSLVVFSKVITKNTDQSFIHKYTLYDLAGISLYSKTLVMPSYNSHITLEDLSRIYTPSSNEPLFGSWRFKHLLGPSSESERNETNRLWLQSIISHPIAYAKHRLKVFAHVLGISSHVQFSYHMRVSPNQMGVTNLPDNPTVFRTPAQKLVEMLQQSLFFRAYVYLLINIFFLYLSLQRKIPDHYRIPYMVLSLSALLYWLTLIPMTGASDFRYNLWGVVCAHLLTLHWIFIKKLPDPRLLLAEKS